MKIPGRSAAEELTPRVRSVVVEPDHDRVAVVWVGEIVLEKPVPPARLGEIQHAAAWPGR